MTTDTPPAMTDAEVAEPHRGECCTETERLQDQQIATLAAENARLRQERNEAQARLQEQDDAAEWRAAAAEERYQRLADYLSALISDWADRADEAELASVRAAWTVAARNVREALAATAPADAPAQSVVVLSAGTPVVLADWPEQQWVVDSRSPGSAHRGVEIYLVPAPGPSTAAQNAPDGSEAASGAEEAQEPLQPCLNEIADGLEERAIDYGGQAKPIGKTLAYYAGRVRALAAGDHDGCDSHDGARPDGDEHLQALRDLRRDVVMAMCTEDDDEERSDEEIVAKVRAFVASDECSGELLQAAYDERDKAWNRLEHIYACLAVDEQVSTGEVIQEIQALRRGRDEAQREAERLRGAMSKLVDEWDEHAPHADQPAVYEIHAEQLRDALAGSSDTTAGEEGSNDDS